MQSQPLPSDIYLDTSIVIAAAIADTPHSVPSRQFCECLGEFGTRVYFSGLLRMEFANTLRSLALPQRTKPGKPPKPSRLPEPIRQQFQLDQWAGSEAVRHAWMEFGHQQLEAFLSQFVEAVELPVRSGTWAQMLHIQCQYDMKSNDAAHAATAIEYGIVNLATTDREFEPVVDIHVWLARDDRPPLI